MEIHFDNIKKEIINSLSQAKFNIFIAVAWTGDKEIIAELTKCVKKGIIVEMIINNDSRFIKIKDYLSDFIMFGGKIFLYDTKTSLMHNKFCVIDLCTTITGSYNWSFGANFHKENIIIEKENIQVAHKFALQHLLLKKNSSLLSKTKVNYPELVHEINVRSYSILDESNEKTDVVIFLEEGNRTGILQLTTKFKVDDSFIISPIKGFWRSKLNVTSFGEEDAEEFYEFICVDSYYLNYI